LVHVLILMSNGISSCLRKEDGDEIQRLFEQMSSGIDSKKLKEINQSETLQKVKNLVRISIVKKSKKQGIYGLICIKKWLIF